MRGSNPRPLRCERSALPLRQPPSEEALYRTRGDSSTSQGTPAPDPPQDRHSVRDPQTVNALPSPGRNGMPSTIAEKFFFTLTRYFIPLTGLLKATGQIPTCIAHQPALMFSLVARRVAPKETTCGRGSVGRASPCQGEGRGFESRRPLGEGLSTYPHFRWSGREARQRTANPYTRVQIPSPPRAVGAAVARFPDTEEVASSNLASPTIPLSCRRRIS